MELQNNKIPTIVFFVLFLFNSACFAQQTKQQLNKTTNCSFTGNPQLTFIGSKIFDFGEVRKDTFITHKYIFVNTGDTTLVINAANASCQCTKIVIGEMEIAPNDTSFVELTLDTENKINDVRINGVLKTNTKIKFYKFSLLGNVVRSDN